MSSPHGSPRTLTRPDPLALAETLADEIAALLTEAVATRGRATLVVPGGSTPKPLLVALSCRPAPWERLFVTLTDERWVATSDPNSNERQVRELLLQGRAAKAKMVGLKTTAPTPEEAEGDVEARLALVPRPFDVIVLGMGEDGHFASLFPGAAELDAALDLGRVASCTALYPPETQHPRLTLTLPAITTGRHVFLLVAGEVKRAVLEQAARRSADLRALPVAALLRAMGDRLTIASSAE